MRQITVTPLILTPAQLQQEYIQYSGQLCAYLTHSLRGDTMEAECIVQEAFLKAWEKRSSLRDPSAFRSWIYSIALNILRQRKRKKRPIIMEKIETICERPSPEQQVAASQDLDRVTTALAKLPDDQREALLLVRLENVKFREAAEILDIPESTVKTRVRRGLLTLAKALES